MRRSIVCLAMLILAAVLMFRPGDRPQHAVAQDGSAATSTEATTDRFAVPQTSDATVLLTFVKGLKSLQPEVGPTLDDYEERAPLAIRKACERILDLEPNLNSKTHQFARRELLPFRMSDMSEGDSVDADQRKKLASDAVEVLKGSDRTGPDAELATSLATTFEEFAPVDEAIKFYKSLGELFVRSTDSRISLRGEYLIGAARRLGIVGQPFELSGETIDGDGFDLKSLKGKVVLVDFWATWCGHCLDEMPRLKRHYQAYHDRGFEIVSISVDDDREQLQSFLRKQKLPWIMLHDEAAGSEHPAAIQYGIAAYPTSFLLDRNGRVAAVDLRGKQLGRKLAELCQAPTDKKVTYPMLNIGEVVDRMTSAGSRLHKAGKTRSDVELRKQLNRQFVELELPEPNEESLSDRELYRRLSESVFVICSLYKLENREQWQTSMATAFAVTRDGVLTTSCHVFDNDDEADAVIVMDVHRKIYPVRELLAVNKQADTCLFRIEASDLQPLPFADSAPPGSRVWVMGHPGDSFYFLSSGLIANYEKDDEGTAWLNTTADFGQGASGGPVVDEHGNVVGQVSRTYTLYAGGPATRGRPRRVAGDLTQKREKDPNEKPPADVDVADPQMVFKACVPVKTLHSLVKPKKIEPAAHTEKAKE